MEPALEGEAAVLDVKGEVVDVKSAGRDDLDGLVVAHQSIMCHIDIRNVRRLPYVHTAVSQRKWKFNTTTIIIIAIIAETEW